MSLKILSVITIYFFNFTVNKITSTAVNNIQSFFVEFDNRYLVCDQTEVYLVDCLIECCYQCFGNADSCRAFNFKKVTNSSGKHLCEILKASSTDSPYSITVDNQWTYAERTEESVSCVSFLHISVS